MACTQSPADFTLLVGMAVIGSSLGTAHTARVARGIKTYGHQRDHPGSQQKWPTQGNTSVQIGLPSLKRAGGASSPCLLFVTLFNWPQIAMVLCRQLLAGGRVARQMPCEQRKPMMDCGTFLQPSQENFRRLLQISESITASSLLTRLSIGVFRCRCFPRSDDTEFDGDIDKILNRKTKTTCATVTTTSVPCGKDPKLDR